MSKKTIEIWTDSKEAPVDRLYAFHKWLGYKIAQLFNIQKDKEKLIFQLREVVLKSVRKLNEHGFLLDGNALAEHLQSKLNTIAKINNSGKVRDLYVYFKSAWASYVEMTAEELKVQSLHLKCHVSDYKADYKPSIPELEAQRYAEQLREQLAKKRKQNKSEPTQIGGLFDV
jgi:hypothetical protein